MKKLLITALILLISLFPSISCAYQTEFEYNGVSYNVLDYSEYIDSDNYCIIKNGSKIYLFVCYAEDSYFSFALSSKNVGVRDCKYYYYYADETRWVYQGYRGIPTPSTSRYNVLEYDAVLYSSFDIKDWDTGEIVFEATKNFKNPYFLSSKEELSSGKFDTLKIDAGDLNHYDDKIVFNIYKGTSLGNNLYDYTPYKSVLLDSSSSYFRTADLHVQYFIPQEKLGIDISNDKHYMFELKEKGGDTVYSSVSFTVGGLTSSEEIKNSQDVTNDKLDEQTNVIKDQTEVMKEQTETNKNIFEKLGDILSYINPFSENFFVYKLIELLINAIKSLFIPSDGFFGNYFNDLLDWFSDRLGLLFYPFELIIKILTEMLNINVFEPVFNIPDLKEPFTGHVLISNVSFNLNDLVSEDGPFKTLYSIYRTCVTAYIYMKLVNLFKRKYEEVTSK